MPTLLRKLQEKSIMIDNLFSEISYKLDPISNLKKSFKNVLSRKKKKVVAATIGTAVGLLGLNYLYNNTKKNRIDKINKNKKIKEIEYLKEIKKKASNFKNIDNDLDFKNNKQFILKAIKENSEVFKYIDNKFKNDEDFILEAIKENMNVFNHIEKKLKTNEDYIIEIIKINPDILNIIIKSNDRIFVNILKNKDFIEKIKKTKKASLISQLNNFNYKMKRGLFF